MKVGAHIWPWWPSQQWDSAPYLTLACQEVLPAFTSVGIGQMGWVSQGYCLLPPNNNENKNSDKNDRCHGLGLTVWLNRFSPEHEGSKLKGQIRADCILCSAPYTVCPAWAVSPTGRSTFSNHLIIGITLSSVPPMVHSSLCTLSEGEIFSNLHESGLWASGGPTNIISNPYTNSVRWA